METGDEVIAVAGLRPPSPWVLLESSTFNGRYYFFNTLSLESKWALPTELFTARQTAVRLSTTPGEDAPHEILTAALEAAQDAVGRMERQYGASPSRPEGDSSSTFTKRAREMDPRLMSVDLEDSLRSALSKADQIEKQWSDASIPEDSEVQGGVPQGGAVGTVNALMMPSEDAFNNMRDFAAHQKVSGDSEDGLDGGLQAVDSSELYSVLNGLGSGGYSNVLLVRNEQRGDLLAMKVLSKKLLQRQRDRARLRNELRALTEIPPSPFIQRCFAAFESPSHVCFVTEYLGGGDLFFHLTRRVDSAEGNGAGFSEKEARILIAEIVLGLEHMHNHSFIHCDIKVENIMLDVTGHVKLIDFGLSQEITQEEEPMSPIGSLIYMAPELLSKSAGGRHTDWWALGVLAHEMMTGRSPWSSLTDKKLIKRQIKTLKIAPPKSLSAGAGDFICKLLVQDHKKRLGTGGASEVKASDFFSKASGGGAGKGINWLQLEKGGLPPGLTPPRVAFIEAECANALAMYRGADLEPANWSLGVEAVPTLPQCDDSALLSNEQAGILSEAMSGGSFDVDGSGCGGGGSALVSDLLSEALLGQSGSGCGGQSALVSDVLSEALGQTSLGEGGGGGEEGGAGSSSKSSEPALPPPPEKQKQQPFVAPPPVALNAAGFRPGPTGEKGRGAAAAAAAGGEGVSTMRKGATPRGPKPKTPKYTSQYGQSAGATNGGEGGGSGSTASSGRTPKASGGGFGRSSSKASTPGSTGGATWR